MAPLGAPQRDYSWLPDHHLAVAATLAHVDELIDQAGQALYEYLKPPGPLNLTNVADRGSANVIVSKVAPLPAAAARYAADALTQMRAAIEHTLYAEVEFRLGRALTTREARAIEMPACSSDVDFARWVNQGVRKSLPPLHADAPLVRRIRDLQPFQRRDQDEHPLRVLSEHTNLAKHRTPAVAATLLGLVRLDVEHPEVMVTPEATPAEEDRPVEVGDVLVSGPAHVQVPISIWPKVCIQRPHTGAWHIFMHELGDIEDWVRRIAVPLLISGGFEGTPLPPQLDTRVGHDDLRGALVAAGVIPANRRATTRIEAATVRVAFVEIMGSYVARQDIPAIRAWTEGLDDSEALRRQELLAQRRSDPIAVMHILGSWINEVGVARRW